MIRSTLVGRPSFSLVTACLALSIAGASVARADDNKPSRVYGKVVTADGKPAASISIQIAPLAVAKGSGGPGAGRNRGSRSIGPFNLPSFSELMAPAAPIATVQTDSSGAYEFKVIPPGNYKVTAGARSAGVAYVIVDVDGQGNAIEQDITLQAPKN